MTEIEKLTQLKPDPTKAYWKPDRINIIVLLLIGAFAFCSTYNFTLLNYEDYGIPILKEVALHFKWMVVQFLAISCLAYAGVLLRAYTDNAKLKDDLGNYLVIIDQKGNKNIMTYTSSSLEGFTSGKSVGETFLWFALAFGLNVVASIAIFRGFTMSVIGITTNQVSFGVITAVSEEAFFSYGLQRVFEPYVRELVIPFSVGIFVVYHMMVYAGQITALIYVGVGRLVYSIIYLYKKDIASIMLAHIVNNILAFTNTAPAFSIFANIYSLF